MPEPKNKFYTYTETDITWAQPIGYGSEESYPVFFVSEKDRFYGYDPLNPRINAAKRYGGNKVYVDH
jgi:hypothetical protein